MEELRLRYIGQDSWDRYVYEDQNGVVWKLLDCCCPREVCEERGDRFYSSTGNAYEGEPGWPMNPGVRVVLED